MTFVFLLFFAFLAGLVDAVGGGGGLIQIPALLVAYPSTPLPFLLGTNKFASACGTGIAAYRFIRNVTMPWRVVAPAIIVALVFAFVGAKCASMLDPTLARPVVVVLMVFVLGYTLFRPKLGELHAPALSYFLAPMIGAAIGASIGFYDGFFGPGTGAFLIFAFVSLVRFDFLHASAASKLVNFATNIAALAYFIPTGNVDYPTGIGMAVANILGAVVGSHLALTRGARFVRALFIVMAVALLLKQVQLLMSGAG